MLKRNKRRIVGFFLIAAFCIGGTVGCGAGGPPEENSSEANTPPQAKVKTDHDEVLAGVSSVQLDGSDSSDPDGDTVTYAWSIASAPAGSSAAISEPETVNPTFTPDVAGDYIIQLVVNDGAIASSPDSMPLKGKKIAVYGDFSGSEVADFLVGRSISVDNFPGNASINNLTDYCMIVFGDKLLSANALTLFDAADQAGVNILGIGTYDNDLPLGVILAQGNRLGLSFDDDFFVSPMEIEPTAGVIHPIFTGIDTSGTIQLENSAASERDEQVYYTNAADPASPADWTELAVMGPNMRFGKAPAIVEFSTPKTTKVILDGSANTYDSYDYWTQTRWDLLYNEVVYLAQ